jgi:hypothetical protein
MNWKRKTVVLGSEIAAAKKCEDARIASGVIDESPLPVTRYDQERGDYDLVAVCPVKLDLDLRDLTDDFVGWDADRRSKVIQIIPSDDLYTLIHFVKRASVLALNQDTLEWCRAGLVALSMIDETRVDWRDVKWSAGLLEHTLVTVSGVADSIRKEIGTLSKSSVVFLSQLPKESMLREWGYSEIKQGDAVGLIQTSYSNYKPTLDLTNIALRISEQLSEGRYRGEVEIATDLSEIWFDRDRRDDVRARLTACRGAAKIQGTLRDGYGAHNQLFIEWVIEMPSSSDCEFLMDAVGSGTPLGGRYAAGISEGKLFAILVAGSAQEGVEPFESPSSLRDLAEQTKLILKGVVV